MAFEGKWFNAKYYLEQNLDVANNWGGTALEHYLTWGAGENRAPNTWFDAQYYRANNPDLQTMTAVELFQHYELHGYAEGRVPSGLYENFDAAAYLADYADLEPGGITLASALNHYLTFGIAEGRTAKNTDGSIIIPSDPDDGSSFTLTTAIAENIVGTSGNDTISGFMDGIANTFNAGDTIDGFGGVDTFNLYLEAAGSTAPAGSSVKNVEIINLISDGTGSFAAINAAYFQGATQIWQKGLASGAAITNVGEGVTIGFADGASPILADEITVADGVDEATVALSGVGAGSVVAFGETTPADLITVNVSGSVALAGALTIDLDGGVANPTAEETLNLALTSDSAVTITSSSLLTVDASNSTGDLTIIAPATVETLMGGSGDDTLTGGAASQLIEGGAGDDTIVAGNIADEVINGGAGLDGITLGAAGQAQTVITNAGESGMTLATIDTILNFATGEDMLDFNLVAGSATNFLFDASAGGFLDAVVNANTAFDSDADLVYVQVTDGIDSWLFVDTDGNNAPDMAVELTGVLLTIAPVTDIIA